jgi:hypothetical protein
LCDAAIQLLANDGARGLSHAKVDRALDLPDGTTSFYYRTRASLLHAVADRIAELDVAGLSSMGRGATSADGGSAEAVSTLAAVVFMASSGPGLIRTKARLELSLHADRDPILAAKFAGYAAGFRHMAHDLIAALNPEGMRGDATLLEDQRLAVMTFISGVIVGFAVGSRDITSAEQIDHHIAAIIAGEQTRHSL